MGLIKNGDLLLQMGFTGFLLVWWLHTRSRVAGELCQRDTGQVQRRLFCFGGDKMDLQQTLDGATWPVGGSSNVGCY